MRLLSITILFTLLLSTLCAADINLEIAAQQATPVLPEKQWEQYPTLPEALQENTPLIMKSNGVGAAQFMYIRGYNKGIQVYLDGVPLPMDITGLTDLSLIPTAIIDRVEVAQGFDPQSPTATGSIYIYTKKPLDGATSFDTSAYIAGNNTAMFSLGVRGAIAKKVPLTVNYTKTQSDGFQYNSAYDKQALNLSFTPLKNQTFTYIYLDSYTRLPNGTNVAIGDWDGNKEKQPNSFSDYMEDTLHQANYNGSYQKLSYGAAYANLKRTGLSYGDITQIKSQDYYGFASYQLLENLKLGAQYKHSQIDTNASYFTKGNYDWDLASAYLDSAWDLKLADLELGARYDYHSFWGNNFGYKAKLAKGKGTRFFVSGAQGSIYPSVADYDKHIGNLEAEQNLQFEAGLEGAYTDFNFKIAPYASYIDDKINIVNIGFDYFAQNVGRARIFGLEAQATKTIGQWRGTVIYTLADNQTKPYGNGDYVKSQYAPSQFIRFINTVNVGSYKFIGVLMASSSQYSSNNKQGDRLPGYADIELTVEKKISTAVIFATVSNLLDRHYAYSGAFGTFYPNPGRILKLGVRYQFFK